MLCYGVIEIGSCDLFDTKHFIDMSSYWMKYIMAMDHNDSWPFALDMSRDV